MFCICSLYWFPQWVHSQWIHREWPGVLAEDKWWLVFTQGNCVLIFNKLANKMSWKIIGLEIRTQGSWRFCWDNGIILESYKYSLWIYFHTCQTKGVVDLIHSVHRSLMVCWICDRHGARHFEEKKDEPDMSVCPWEINLSLEGRRPEIQSRQA